MRTVDVPKTAIRSSTRTAFYACAGVLTGLLVIVVQSQSGVVVAEVLTSIGLSGALVAIGLSKVSQKD